MQRTAQVLHQQSQKQVPWGYEMQIAVVTTATAWLAMKWALESEDGVAEEALISLILDWWGLQRRHRPWSDLLRHLRQRLTCCPRWLSQLPHRWLGQLLHPRQHPRLAVSAVDVHVRLEEPRQYLLGFVSCSIIAYCQGSVTKLRIFKDHPAKFGCSLSLARRFFEFGCVPFRIAH